MNNEKFATRTVKAFGWDVSGKLLKQGVTFFVTIVLARLLGPEDFGFVAMSMFFVSVSTIMVDFGLSASLVQAKSVNQEEYSTVFYVNAAFGAILSLALFLSSDLISAFYEEDRIAVVMKALSVNPLIGSLIVVPIAILTRELRFRVQTYASFASSVISGGLAIILAYSGYGVWSLVLQSVFGLMTQGVIIWMFEKWRPSLSFSTSVLRAYLPFSGRMFVSGAINAIYERIDLLLIGKMFSAYELGIYYRAISFNSIIVRYAGNSLVRVLFPYFSRIQADLEEVQLTVNRSLHLLSMILFLLSGIVIAASHEIVILLFSERWLSAVPYLRLVMLFAYAYPVSAVLVNVLSGTGQAKAFLKLEVYKKVLLTICMPLGLLFGIKGYLISMGIAYIGTVWLNAHMTSSALRTSEINMLKTIYQYGMLVAFPVVATLIAGGSGTEYRQSYMLLLSALVKTIGVTGIYITLNIVFKTDGWTMMHDMVAGKFKSRSRMPKIL